MNNLFNLRKDFTLKDLDESSLSSNPYDLFQIWLDEAIEAQVVEPNAMCLSTSTKDRKPSSRIVLLKQLKNNGFVFFTNYESRKAQQIAENKYCALNFPWLALERQVQVEGIIEKISNEESDSYFEVRPEKSKLGAWASPQSRKIPNREYLEKLVSTFNAQFAGQTIARPNNWGGYILVPHSIEFWQGRPSRLHDRIKYTCVENGSWIFERLAP